MNCHQKKPSELEGLDRIEDLGRRSIALPHLTAVLELLRSGFTRIAWENGVVSARPFTIRKARRSARRLVLPSVGQTGPTSAAADSGPVHYAL